MRSHFLTKLNQGLYKLSLPLEYMAIFAHSANVSEPAFKQRAKQLFIANIQRRRAFLNKHPSYFRDASKPFMLFFSFDSSIFRFLQFIFQELHTEKVM